MVFKLIRTDCLEPKKFELPAGTHLIGRGTFLDCDDMRVSRNHGEFKVTVDSVSIKSLHQNPCFYVRRSTKKRIPLNQECTINLSHGDKIGLLPDTFWYELLDLKILEQDSALFSAKTVTQNDNKHVDSTKNGSVTPKPIKRSTSDDSSAVDVKKVKTEPDDTKDVKPGPSNNQAGSCDDQNGPKSGVPPSSVEPPARRERCFYGRNCFRRNSKHKARYSHPQDSDWGTEERVECPRGQTCRRRDLRHWRDYTHPDGVLPPTTQPPTSGITRQNIDEDDESDNEDDDNDNEDDDSDNEDDDSDNEDDDSDNEEDDIDNEEYSIGSEDENDSDPEDVISSMISYNS